MQDEAEQRRCVEQAASELRQILAGKRLPRGGVYVPGQQPGMGPPQVDAFGPPAAGPVIGVACARFALSTILRMFADCTREIFTVLNCLQGFQQPGGPGMPGGAPPYNPYTAPPPGILPAGQATGAYGQPPPYGQAQPPAVPGVQSTSLPLGFEAAPEFNVVQRLKGPSECLTLTMLCICFVWRALLSSIVLLYQSSLLSLVISAPLLVFSGIAEPNC